MWGGESKPERVRASRKRLIIVFSEYARRRVPKCEAFGSSRVQAMHGIASPPASTTQFHANSEITPKCRIANIYWLCGALLCGNCEWANLPISPFRETLHHRDHSLSPKLTLKMSVILRVSKIIEEKVHGRIVRFLINIILICCLWLSLTNFIPSSSIIFIGL